jgi:hypothetical protein
VIGAFGPLQKSLMGAFHAVKHLSDGSQVQTLARPRAITLSTQNLDYVLALSGGMQVIQAMSKTIGRLGGVTIPLKPALQLFPYAPIDEYLLRDIGDFELRRNALWRKAKR